MKRIIIIFITYVLIATAAYAADGMRVTIAPTNIEFHLVNPQGLISGYTPNGIVNQNPEVDDYVVLGVTKPDPITDPYEEWHTINQDAYPAHVSQGKYQLVIYGTNTPIKADIGIEYWWINHGTQGPKYVNLKLVYPNVIWTYKFEITSSIPSYTVLPLVKVSTPADLIKDLTIAGQLGYIGNPKFVSELTKEINEIEKNKILYEKDDTSIPPNQITKKEYQELLKKITEKYNNPAADEFVKEEAYTVLKEDLEYIIGHL